MKAARGELWYNFVVSVIRRSIALPVMELVVNQQYQNQLVVNRFHYIASGTPAAVTHSFGLLSATGFLAGAIVSGSFPEETMARSMQDLQVGALQYVSAYARDLYSVTDFYESPYPSAVDGNQGSAAGASPFEALGFYSSRVRTDVRRGQKRIAGYPGAWSTPGGVIQAAAADFIAGFAGEMSEVQSYDDEGNTLTYSPAVLGLEKVIVDGAPVYRLYSTPEEQLEHAAVGVLWQPYSTARSQVSRQYGRGA